MVKAIARTADGKLLMVLGLSEGNIQHLRNGKPIYFDMTQLGAPNEPIGHVTVFAAKTEQELSLTLQTMIGPDTIVHAVPEGTKTPT